MDRGHFVHFFCMKHSAECGPDRWSGLTALQVRDRTFAAQKLSQLLSDDSFDIVHDMGLGFTFDIFHSHVGSLQAMEAGKHRSLTHLQKLTNLLIKPFSSRRKRLNRLARLQFQHPDAWYIAVAKMVKQGLQVYEGIRPEKIFCLPNGVDTNVFHPDVMKARRRTSRNRFHIHQNELILSTIAHNHRLKGIPQLVHFLRSSQHVLPSIHLLIVGGHHQKPISEKLGRHTISYLGPIDDPIDVYAASDIYVHPTFYDACSLTVLEGMACGLPCITTRSNGASERIDDGKNGFVIDSASDLKHLASCIEFLADSNNRRSMGMAARLESERWTREDNFLSTELLYHARVEAKQQCDAVQANRLKLKQYGASRPVMSGTNNRY